MRPSRAEFAVLGLLLVPAHSARGQAIGQGFDLERAGQYQRAATVYFTTLRGEPTNLAALLGLERVLPSLSRLPDLLPAAQRAVAASPRNAALRALLLRTYVALNESDSARAVAQRWTAEQPRDEAPYREWAIALEDAHRFEEARQVFLFGRRALGRPGVFGIELGELLERVGVGRGGARMGGRAERGTGAAPERRELARRGARGAAGADRARGPGGRPQSSRAPARGRAAARLGPARARLECVRADRRGAVRRRGDRAAALRRPGEWREHSRCPSRPGTRACALCRHGTRTVGGASPGGGGAGVSRGRRPGRGTAHARAGSGRLHGAARCTGARPERVGGSPDR